jgi:SAM-dependent methyltransferase
MADDPVRQALITKFRSRISTHWRVVLPVVPGLIDEYVRIADSMLTGACKSWAARTPEEKRATLQAELDEAFATSPRSRLLLDWGSDSDQLSISIQVQSITANYDTWLDGRGTAPFGTHADARVWLLAEELTNHRRDAAILDIGAGTGRNALALARHGYTVDAVELSGRFAAQIRANAAAWGVTGVRVLECDVFATEGLRDDYRMIFASEVVSDFRSIAQVRALFELAAKRLTPGGRLLFSVFLANDDWTPTPEAREMGQYALSAIFTADELAAAVADLPLALIADDSVHDYEKAHLPADAWPPTTWYENWTTGRDVFGLPSQWCPIELRWLVYERAY